MGQVQKEMDLYESDPVNLAEQAYRHLTALNPLSRQQMIESRSHSWVSKATWSKDKQRLLKKPHKRKMGGIHPPANANWRTIRVGISPLQHKTFVLRCHCLFTMPAAAELSTPWCPGRISCFSM